MGIQFGTDGWRAVIGRDFTPENVAQVAQGFSNIYPSLPEAGRPVYVGYDRRRQSCESAENIARVLLGNGIAVRLSSQYCPTPCVSWLVKTGQGAAGVMVTASHNPPEWNGIKFKESYGGAASSDFLAPIEKAIAANQERGKAPGKGSMKTSAFSHFDPHGAYLDNLASLVDREAIRKSGLKVLCDPMYGAGAGFLEKLLGKQVTAIHTAADPDFGGLHPEPIRPYVDEALRTMAGGGYDLCLITDGDADRIGAADERGTFVSSHEIFALLLKHLVETRRMTGKVLKSISTTVMIDRLCAGYGLPMETTPIGFKHLSPAMKEAGVLIGGEESGGIGMPHHICERDGLYCGLLLLEMTALRGQSLGTLKNELQKEVGPCFYKRIDWKLSPDRIGEVKRRLAAWEPAALAGKKIRKKTLIDGTHFTLEDESWLLIRSSGTEPLLRTYAEAPSERQVELLLGEAKKLTTPD